MAVDRQEPASAASLERLEDVEPSLESARDRRHLSGSSRPAMEQKTQKPSVPYRPSCIKPKITWIRIFGSIFTPPRPRWSVHSSS